MAKDDVKITGKIKNSKPVDPPNETPNETITVDKEVLLDMQKQIKILRESTRQDRLDQADKKYNTKVKYAKGFLKRLDGKLIVKWLDVGEEGSQAKQDIIYQGQTPVNEKLIGHYITIDGEEIAKDSVLFVRSDDIEKFNIIERMGETLIIEFHNPELAAKYPEYSIHTKYINP